MAHLYAVKYLDTVVREEKSHSLVIHGEIADSYQIAVSALRITAECTGQSGVSRRRLSSSVNPFDSEEGVEDSDVLKTAI